MSAHNTLLKNKNNYDAIIRKKVIILQINIKGQKYGKRNLQRTISRS